MKIKLKNGKIASDAKIMAVQAILGCRLSESFKQFVRDNDGAAPETNIFKVGDDNECGVSQFIPLDDIPNERTRIQDIGKAAYPVAWAEGGNYVFIDGDRSGAVFFWDHEAPERITKLAPSFREFLDTLEPFDAKNVALKPDEVKKVWVDPEFRKDRKG